MFRGGLPLTLGAPSKQSTPTHRTTRSPSRLHESQAPSQERRTTSSPSPVLKLSHSREVTYEPS